MAASGSSFVPTPPAYADNLGEGGTQGSPLQTPQRFIWLGDEKGVNFSSDEKNSSSSSHSNFAFFHCSSFDIPNIVYQNIQENSQTTKLIKIKFRKKKVSLDVLTGDSCRKESSSMVVSFSMQSLVRKKIVEAIRLVSSHIFQFVNSCCRLLTDPRPAGEMRRVSSL
ncbi:hypothetical protein TNCV_3508411 [Trichonephila clavipes]|nr:hypothetical protein TNCV_3508411 [Trichonephila clavipes]